MRLLSRRTYLCMAVVYCLLGMGTVCHAKKKRFLKHKTDSPTMAPIRKPEKDPEPEAPAAPAAPPPDPPSVSPTKDPTASPSTSDPTKSPTAEPTLLPTDSPTASPTGSPTVSPSSSPTASPTTSPTSNPTKLADVEVELALFTLDLTTTGSVSVSRLESDLATLLTTEVLHRAFPSFGHVNLQVTLDSSSERRRGLEVQNMQAVVEGSAWFTDESDLPSKDQINEFLDTYFSIFETDDLTQLLKVGNPRIAKAEFILETETTEVTGESETSPSNLAPGAIMGVAVASAALMAAIGILVWQQRRRRGLSSGRKRWRKPASSPARTATDSQDRNRETYLAPNHDHDLSVDLSLAASSTADSMFTSNSDLKSFKMKRNIPSSDRYDAKRLDAVIQSAHQFSTEGARETSSTVGSLGTDFPDLLASSPSTEAVDLSLAASSTADSMNTSSSDLKFLDKTKSSVPSPVRYDAKRLDTVIQSAQKVSTGGAGKTPSTVGSLETDFPDLLASSPSTEDSKNLEESKSFERSSSM